MAFSRPDDKLVLTLKSLGVYEQLLPLSPLLLSQHLTLEDRNSLFSGTPYFYLGGFVYPHVYASKHGLDHYGVLRFLSALPPGDPNLAFTPYKQDTKVINNLLDPAIVSNWIEQDNIRLEAEEAARLAAWEAKKYEDEDLELV